MEFMDYLAWTVKIVIAGAVVLFAALASSAVGVKDQTVIAGVLIIVAFVFLFYVTIKRGQQRKRL